MKTRSSKSKSRVFKPRASKLNITPSTAGSESARSRPPLMKPKQAKKRLNKQILSSRGPNKENFIRFSNLFSDEAEEDLIAHRSSKDKVPYPLTYKKIKIRVKKNKRSKTRVWRSFNCYLDRDIQIDRFHQKVKEMVKINSKSLEGRQRCLKRRGNGREDGKKDGIGAKGRD